MLSLDKMHFSAKNSFLSILKKNNNITLNTVYTGNLVSITQIICSDILSEEFLPWELKFTTKCGEHKLCLFGNDGICIRGKGEAITLEYIYVPNVYTANFVCQNKNTLKLCDCYTDTFHILTVQKGALSVDTKKRPQAVYKDYIRITVLPDANGEYEFTFCISTKEFPAFSIRTYDEYSALMKNDYMIWEEKMRCKNEHDKICSYILWSNIVSGIGNFDKEAIVMSKSGMARLWSWDNTFNALDLADKDFELSFNQFIYPYRYMDSHGRTPDCIASTCITRAFVKAPVQGWIYKQLVTKNKKYADTDIIYKIYFHMKKNTEWWLNFRGETPCYYHGNDSGSDNSTCFDKNEIIESPDLIAFLSVQCDVLSQMAEKLNMYTDIRIYKHLSDELLQKCLTYFENGEIFVRDGVSKEIYRTQSLMPFRMIVLENKLPQEIKQYIITKLENDFLCPFGLASEAKNSPEYRPDSYWRGPAWAPDQIICSLALKNMGENELSEKISQNYKSALEKSGFSENHDAITGEGLRCNAYTWAANAYRIL